MTDALLHFCPECHKTMWDFSSEPPHVCPPKWETRDDEMFSADEWRKPFFADTVTDAAINHVQRYVQRYGETEGEFTVHVRDQAGKVTICKVYTERVLLYTCDEACQVVEPPASTD